MGYPHPYLTISLLNGCNKVCKHCYRTAIPVDHGFKLNEREAMLCLDDASSLNTACLLAGGEPTIWRDSVSSESIKILWGNPYLKKSTRCMRASVSLGARFV